MGFPDSSDGKESELGDPGSISELGRSPGEENGYPLLCSCLENPMGRGGWRVTVHGDYNEEKKKGEKEKQHFLFLVLMTRGSFKEEWTVSFWFQNGVYLSLDAFCVFMIKCITVYYKLNVIYNILYYIEA